MGLVLLDHSWAKTASHIDINRQSIEKNRARLSSKSQIQSWRTNQSESQRVSADWSDESWLGTDRYTFSSLGLHWIASLSQMQMQIHLFKISSYQRAVQKSQVFELRAKWYWILGWDCWFPSAARAQTINSFKKQTQEYLSQTWLFRSLYGVYRRELNWRLVEYWYIKLIQKDH